MLTPVLKKTIFISLVGDLTLFSLFGFSFGARLPRADFSQVNFLKGIFPGMCALDKGIFINRTQAFMFLGERGISPQLPDSYLKPAIELPFNQEKRLFNGFPGEAGILLKKKESVIMFYPQIPYPITLYFKDRQAVHIELMFNVVNLGSGTTIMIKRKISSGNLEADLLSMRYISRYLSMQKLGFAPNSWQTVKIDLSAK